MRRPSSLLPEQPQSAVNAEALRQRRIDAKLVVDVAQATLELDISQTRTLLLEARIQALRKQRELVESL